MKRIVLGIAVASFSFFPSGCSDECPVKLSPEEVTIYECSDRYGVPSSLLMGIRYAESLNGKFIFSDSYHVLIRQGWIRSYPYRKELVGKYGKQVYWCIGQFQVQFFSARDFGYMGSPMGLTNFQTNCKYASLILRYYIDLKRNNGYIRNAIASYNSGSAELDGNGIYRNIEYVERVYRIYTNRFAGGWKKEYD